MEKQTFYSSAKMLGPFWTLILQITSGRTSETARALPCQGSRDSAGCSASAEFDETRDFQAVSGPASELGGTSQAYTFPSPPVMPGAFVELILTLHRSRSKREAMSYPRRRVLVTG